MRVCWEWLEVMIGHSYNNAEAKERQVMAIFNWLIIEKNKQVVRASGNPEYLEIASRRARRVLTEYVSTNSFWS